MLKAHVTDTVDASADAVWELLSDFTGFDKIVPDLVASCVGEGYGLGAVRDITTVDGDTVTETQSKFDEASKTFSYTVDKGTLPMKNYEATVVITGIGENKCQIDWSSNFEADSLTDEETVELISGFYKVCIAGVQNSMAASSAAAE